MIQSVDITSWLEVKNYVEGGNIRGKDQHYPELFLSYFKG